MGAFFVSDTVEMTHLHPIPLIRILRAYWITATFKGVVLYFHAKANPRTKDAPTCSG